MFCDQCGIEIGGDVQATEIDGEMYCEDCAAEYAYQQSIIAELNSELRLRKAYPAMYESVMYEQMMSEAGRGYLVRGRS